MYNEQKSVLRLLSDEKAMSFIFKRVYNYALSYIHN